jgi:hypothetical protein
MKKKVVITSTVATGHRVSVQHKSAANLVWLNSNLVGPTCSCLYKSTKGKKKLGKPFQAYSF